MIEEVHIDKENGIENKTVFTYDKAGNIVKVTDTNGAQEIYEYDLLNRETKKINKDGGIERSFYNKNSQLVKKILPNEYSAKGENGNGYSYTYDKQGNIISIIAPNGTILETNIYDSEGNLLQRLDGVKSGINCEYDLAGRRKNITTQGGAKQEFTYDAQGNITGIVDGNKNKTEYRLDKWGRITEIIKPNGTSEYFSYDYAGNIIETVDGNGNKIRYRYNLLNKLSEITDQTGEKDYFTYDIEGRVRQHTDRRGNEVQYSYNFYDSLTEKLERKSGLRESYEYYPDGSIKSAIAEGMRYSYSYYTNGSLKEKSASGKRLLSYEYDLNGNKIKQTDVTGKTTEYIYDELDRLLEIHDGGKCITAFKYNDDGTIKEAVSANGMKNLYGYDTDKNLTSLSVNFNGEILAKNRYAYDSNGNRTIKRQLRGTTYYTYDSINQLTNVRYPDYEEQLFYDKAGNRSKRIVNDVTEHYLYDKRNRLIRQVFQQPTGTTAKHYIYDNAENLMNDGERIYKNDAFNRVTRVETTTGQVQINRYDAEGLRYEMEENKKLVQFIFNENREVVVEQSDSDIKRLIRNYDLWASECEPEKTWYHYASDEQGSTVFITDEEKVCNKYDYDAWGNLTTCEEIIPNRFLYTGQQFDQITQQYYLRARFYNPVIARFTKEDVYRGDGLNLYTYCDNNPVIYYDPSGYKKEPNVVIIDTKNDTLENFSKIITDELSNNKNRKKSDVVRDFKYKDVEIHTSKYPHTNNTKGHWETILEKAYEEANTGDVGKILIDSPNNRLDPGKIDPSISRKEPDLIIVSKDGKNIRFYEVPSKTDYDKSTGDYKEAYKQRLRDNQIGLEKRYGKDNVKGDFVEINSSKFINDNNEKCNTVKKQKQYKNLINRR